MFLGYQQQLLMVDLCPKREHQVGLQLVNHDIHLELPL